MTTGREVAGSGAALLVFSLIGLLHVHVVMPRMSRAMRFPAWHEKKWAKRWNYGVPLAMGVIGAMVTVFGLVAWAAGWTFS